MRRSGPTFSGYEVRVGLLRFDTSSLPDGATVTAATLRLHVTGRTVTNGRSVVGEWYDAAQWPLDGADYALSAASSAHAGTPLASLAVGSQSELLLQNLGAVSRTGSTGIRLHIDGGEPNGENGLYFASSEHATLPEAQLVVSYTTAPPTAPENLALPVVSGVAEVGRTLSGSSGSWSGTAPIGFAYRWQRCDGAGAGCVDVAGATSASYVVVAGDVGSRLRVVVTASNGAGSASAVSVASAVVVAAPSSGTLTFAVAAGADDGDVKVNNMLSGLPYPPATAPIVTVDGTTVGMRRSGPTFSGYEVRVGLLRFDTSSLPDGATVTAATLRLHVTGRTVTNGRSVVGEWYDAAQWPLDGADYALSAASSAHAGTPLASLAVGSQSELLLQNLGAVSRTGSTGIRLHIDGGEPNGENGLYFASSEHATLPEAQLVVSYTTP